MTDGSALLTALAAPGVLALEPCLAFGDPTAVSVCGGVAILPQRAVWLAAHAAGIPAMPEPTGIAAGAFRQVVVHVHRGRAAAALDIARAWALLPLSGSMLVCGENDQGVSTVLRRLADELGQPGETVAEPTGARIVRFLRRVGATPQTPAAQEVPLVPASANEPGGDARLMVAPGVLGHDDEGTALLVGSLSLFPPPVRFADLGCAAGQHGIAGLVRWPRATAVLTDADHHAVACAAENLVRLGLDDRATATWWDVSEATPTQPCELVLVKPPAYAGVPSDLAPAQALFRAAAGMLKIGGRALVIANRTVPYERELEEFGSVKALRNDSRFKVIEVVRG